jgi:replicative DNA helicase
MVLEALSPANGFEPLPPHNSEAEESVLGALLMDPEALDVVASILSVDDWYHPRHRDIYAAMLRLRDAGQPTDFVMVCDELERTDLTQRAGGVEYLSRLLTTVPTSIHAEYYAQIVYRTSMSRRAIALGGRIAALGYEDIAAVAELVARIEQEVATVTAGARARSQGPVPLADLLRDYLESIQLGTPEEGAAMARIPSGYIDLDRVLGGFARGDLIILAARPSVGKAQPLDSLVLTPSGYCAMRDIATGDQVIGSDGKPTRVTGVFPQGQMQTYRVVFSDGGETFCTAEHLWFTQSRLERRRGEAGSVKTLEEIERTIHRPDSETSPNHAMPVVGPVEFSSRDPQLLTPYVLGLLLGDGSFTEGSVRFSNPEKDIQERLAAQLPVGDSLHIGADGKECRIRRLERNKDICETKKALMHYGLFGKGAEEKFIPEGYLLSSVAERTDLLRGLIDTDGSVNWAGGSIEYTTASPRLASDVRFLVRSLGGIVSMASRIPKFKYRGEMREGRESHRLIIQFPDGLVPVSSQKHLSHWTFESARHYRSIVKVELWQRMECQCIAVEAKDGLYVTDDFIVTHNTALSMAIARNAGVRFNRRVLIFSVEMSGALIAQRFLSMESGVDSARIREGRLSDVEVKQVGQALDVLQVAPIWVDDTPQIELAELCGRARKLAAAEEIDLIVVDYLGLVRAGRGGLNRVQEISEIAGQLKGLARDLNIPLLVLSQLSRAVEQRNPHIPMLSDLRDSGAVEQDADVVVFLYREDMYDRDTERKGITDVIVAKHRNGPTGQIELLFLDRNTRFVDLEHQHSAPGF